MGEPKTPVKGACDLKVPTKSALPPMIDESAESSNVVRLASGEHAVPKFKLDPPFPTLSKTVEPSEAIKEILIPGTRSEGMSDGRRAGDPKFARSHTSRRSKIGNET